MHSRMLMLVAVVVAVSGCTGAKVFAGSTPVEDALVVYWHCDDGQLGTHWQQTDSSGAVFWDPFDAHSSEVDTELIVPAGKVVVTVEKGAISRQRIITHAFNAKCDIPFNGSMQSLDCSKDGFNLAATVDGYSVDEDAPVYKMPMPFEWRPGIPVAGIPGSSNMVFPAEWPASCRSGAAVGDRRRVIQTKLMLDNIR